ncbi:MAG TPA: site-2 protease family protein [Thermodesulfobacteriota bacterium]|nr:site-2 protease family protein [Thermodesulfobacteriota bacterium]
MAKGIRLFRVLGIRISVDWSWFIIFVIFAWSLAYGYFPFRLPGLPHATYIALGFISSLLLFACVLIHELSHSYTANRLGLDIHEITLFIFGGVAELTKEPDDPVVELKIALAGPGASLVLAAVFWGVSKLMDASAWPLVYQVVSYLALINLVLLIFNMIPGFPLDGGRVFRAIWWARTGDVDRATRIASQIGKGFAMFLILWGFLSIFTGNFTGGLWSVLIGVFVQQAAESGYQQLLVKRALEGVKVGEIMSKGVICVPDDRTVAEAVDEYFFKYHFVSFPVTSGGKVAGLITLNHVRALGKDKWQTTAVSEVMHRLAPEDILKPGDGAMEVLIKTTPENGGRFPVVEGGELVGIVSRRDIMKLIEFKSGLGK